jgi:hypothetical protein
MKSKDKKCSSKTSSLVSDSMKEETRKALKYIHEIAEEIRKQKQLAQAG